MNLNENSQAGSKPSAGILSEQLTSVYDVLNPTYMGYLCKRFGLQFAPFWDWFSRMGREEPINANGTWWGHEDDRYIRTLKVLSDVADPGANNDAVFQLDPTEIDLTTGRYYGRKTEIITMPGSNVQARIYDITGTSPNIYFHLRPVKAGNNIGAIAAGTELAITNGAKASGTGQIDGIATGYTERQFFTQILDEKFLLEGPMIAQQLKFDFFDENGKKVPYKIISDLTVQATVRLNSKLNGMYLLGEEASNPNMTEVTPGGATNLVRTSKGIIPQISSLGQTTVIPKNTMTVDDYYDIGLNARIETSDSNILLHCMGQQRRNEMHKLMKAFVQNNGTDFTSDDAKNLFGIDKSTARALSLGLRKIDDGSDVHLLKTVDDWTNPVQLGSKDYDAMWWDIVIPISSFKDPVNGQKLDNICTRYVDYNGYNRRMEAWKYGAAGGDQANYQGDIDQITYNWRTHQGLQSLKVNQWQWIKS